MKLTDLIVVLILILVNAFFRARSRTGRRYNRKNSGTESSDSDDFYRMWTFKSFKDHFDK